MANERFIYKDCPLCKGYGWIRGSVGGIYDCHECWKFKPIDQNEDVKKDRDTLIKKRGRPPKNKEL